jgi:hypothetical protein
MPLFAPDQALQCNFNGRLWNCRNLEQSDCQVHNRETRSVWASEVHAMRRAYAASTDIGWEYKCCLMPNAEMKGVTLTNVAIP